MSLLVAGATMFSSKVIKPEQLKEHRVHNVNYQVLIGNADDENDAKNVYLEADGFTPLFFNDAAGPRGEEVEHRVLGLTQEPSVEADGESSREVLEAGMIAIAEDDLQRRVAEAYARGLDEGKQAAERGLSNVFKALRDGLEGLDSLRERVFRESEGDLLALSILIARKIIMQELKSDQRILANIVNETINCCSEFDKITVRLHPDDYRLCLESRQEFLPMADEEGRITLAPDESVKLGGCQVETPTGTVDARIEVQLEEIFRRCLEERGIPYEPSIKLAEEG